MFDEKWIWKLQDEAGLKLKKKNWNHICAIFEVQISSELTNKKHSWLQCWWKYHRSQLQMKNINLYRSRLKWPQLEYFRNKRQIIRWPTQSLWTVSTFATSSILNFQFSRVVVAKTTLPMAPDHHINDHDSDYQINDHDPDFHIHDHDINQIWLHINRHDHTNDQERR